MQQNENNDSKRRKGAFVAWGVAAALLGVIGTFWAIPNIENDLEKTTKERLTAAGISADHLVIEGDGRIIKISGLKDGDDAEAIKKEALEWGVRRVEIEDDSSGTGRNDTNFKLAWADAKAAELSGAVSNDEAAGLLTDEAAAAFGGADAIDGTVDVDSAVKPSEALGTVAKRLPQFASLLTNASLELDGTKLTVNGDTDDPDALAKLINDLEADGVNVDYTAADASGAGATPDIAIDWTAAGATITGSLPGAGDLTAITDGLSSVASVSSDAVATGEATEANAATAALGGQLPTLAGLLPEGSLTLVDKTLTISGEVAAEDEAALKAAIDALTAAGLSVDSAVTVADAGANGASGASGASGATATTLPATTAPPASTAPPATTAPDGLDTASQAVENELNAFVAANPIPFASGSAELLPEADVILNKVVELLNKAASTNATVEGYTDSQGEDAANQALSTARAEAVKAALVQKGVTGSRLTAVGFGEQKPVGDNATAEGRAANRRVVFNLTKGA